MKLVKSLLATAMAIFTVFVVASLLDIVLAAISPRFYSTVAFIVIFGVAGVFAATMGYMYGRGSGEKTESGRWVLIIFIILAGLLFFFVLAKLEGGDYEPAFKSFGATLAISTLLFIKGDVE